MPLHELRTWIQPLKRTNTLKLHENFTKSSLCSNYHYLTPLSNLCMLALAPGFSLSALSCQSKCPVSSSIFIPAHSAYTTDIPLTVCLQCPFFLPTCVTFPLSGSNSSFCLALCSLALFSGLFWPLVLPSPAF